MSVVSKRKHPATMIFLDDVLIVQRWAQYDVRNYSKYKSINYTTNADFPFNDLLLGNHDKKAYLEIDGDKFPVTVRLNDVYHDEDKEYTEVYNMERVSYELVG